MGGNFEMLNTKSKLELKFENDLSKNCNFLPTLAKFFSEHLSTIALQWMSHGTGLYSEFMPIRK